MSKKANNPPNLYSFLLPRLRRLTLQWYPRQEVLKRIRIMIDDGYFKNGNPKVVVRYKCEKCGKVTLLSDIQIDHIVPVGNFAKHGSWDSYLNAMFCSSDDLQGICVDCHQEKTTAENRERNEQKKKKIQKKRLTKKP